MRQWLLITSGYPFSGKSTLARAIAKRLGIALVAVDDQLASLGAEVAAESPGDREWLRAYRAAYGQIERELTAGQSVVFDSVGFRWRDRDRARRIAARHGADSVVIWLNVSAGEARERLERNRAEPTRNQVPVASFNRIVTDFEPPQDDEPAVIYSPEVQPDVWVEQVLRPIIE